jgi:hypothetical protein
MAKKDKTHAPGQFKMVKLRKMRVVLKINKKIT